MGALPLLKTAAAPGAQEESAEESNTARNLAVGAAAASPFAGLIGQQKIIHDPYLNPRIRRFRTMADIQRQARPGDVMMTTKPGGSVWKNTIMPLSGSDFYHSQPVIAGPSGSPVTLTAGQYRGERLSPRGKGLDSLPAFSKNQEYPDVMLLRPKTPMTPEQLKAFQRDVIARGTARYNKDRATSTWLKEVFMPKIKGRENAPSTPICEGDVCSTLPANAYRGAGKPVVPGKRPDEVFPSDFLRSKQFKPVGVRLTNEYPTPRWLRRASPYLTRGAIGAGLAGATYAATEDPNLVGGTAGAVAGASLASRFLSHGNRKKPGLPSAFTSVASWADANKATRRSHLMSQFGKKLPAALAGGALGYYAMNRLRGQEPEKRAAEGDPEAEDNTARNTAMGVAAAAPFAGLIGQGRLRHDPHYNRNIRRVSSNSQIARLARPGDVVVYTDPEANLFKTFSNLNSGSEFYHTMTVHGGKSGRPLGSVADDFGETRLEETMRNASPNKIRSKTDTLARVLQNQGNVDTVLLRPKKRMSAEELKAFSDEAARRSAQKYNMSRATTSGLADVFVPKVPGLERTAPTPRCEGEICSSLPSQTAATLGRTHITGKRPQDALPSDYLRSKNFKAVATRSTAAKPGLLRRASPLLLRAGLGAGLSGLTYTVAEAPEASAALAGTAGGMALSGMLAKRLGMKTPSIMGAAARAMDGRMNGAYAGALAKTRLPGAILGGVGGYFGAKKLRELIRGPAEEPAPVG